mmetsp:Transcript_18767/g.51581  ORF Transcript_18767/g.51581 Transcript_18767/m.51581 type:complete len:308 (+) Transcript_18767:1724-2647(+)
MRPGVGGIDATDGIGEAAARLCASFSVQFGSWFAAAVVHFAAKNAANAEAPLASSPPLALASTGVVAPLDKPATPRWPLFFTIIPAPFAAVLFLGVTMAVAAALEDGRRVEQLDAAERIDPDGDDGLDGWRDRGSSKCEGCDVSAEAPPSGREGGCRIRASKPASTPEVGTAQVPAMPMVIMRSGIAPTTPSAGARRCASHVPFCACCGPWPLSGRSAQSEASARATATAISWRDAWRASLVLCVPSWSSNSSACSSASTFSAPWACTSCGGAASSMAASDVHEDAELATGTRSVLSTAQVVEPSNQ